MDTIGMLCAARVGLAAMIRESGRTDGQGSAADYQAALLRLLQDPVTEK